MLLVHGLFADDRAWAGVEDAIAKDHRFVAYTQRGFGAGAWEDPTFSRDRHTADLVSILRSLDAPVDLVGWSYGGPIVLRAAATVPDRVRSVVVYEPYVPEMLGGTPETDAIAEGFWGLWGPTDAALEAGDDEAAVRAAIEAAVGLSPGEFDAQDPAVRTMQFENAHTVALQWNAPPPTDLTCEELGTVRAPTLVVAGGATLAAYTAMGTAVAACIPGSETATIEGARHDAPLTAGPALAGLVLGFIDGHQSAATRQQQRGVAVGEEAIARGDRVGVDLARAFDAHQRRDEHQQRRLRQVEVRHQPVGDPEVEARPDEDVGLARPGRDPARSATAAVSISRSAVVPTGMTRRRRAR